MLTVKYWDDRLYPLPEQRDPTFEFIQRIRRRITPEMSVLDIGAGMGERSTYDFRGRCRTMVGVDVDPRVARNPLLDRGIVANANSLPFEDESFDFAFSIYVLEHVEDPSKFCAEVARVLRPGGEFWAVTPNRWHYVATVASLTPTRFHKWLNTKRGRDESDTFPTFYRLNSPVALKSHFREAKMDPIDIDMVEVRPNYLGFALPAFMLGAAYERLVNSTDALRGFRVNFIAGFRKGDPPMDTECEKSHL